MQIDTHGMKDKINNFTKKPWWWDSKVGIGEEVLFPWTPIRVQKYSEILSISLWGRRYDFGTFIFPSQIESKNSEMLSSPIRIILRLKDESIEWKENPIQIDKERPEEVTFSQKVESKSLFLTAHTSVEYDGMIKIDWKIEPHRQIELKELVFEIPLKKEHAKYLYHYPFPFSKEQPVCNSMKLPEEGFVSGFCPFIWLGDEERGFSWFSESDENWHNKDIDKVIEIIWNKDSVILRLHLVSIPLKLAPGGKILNYTFGFQATPVKPVDKDVWDYRIFHISVETYKNVRFNIPEENLDKLAFLGVKTICFHEHWTDSEAYYTTDYKDELKSLIRACHKRGMQILLYFGYLISDIAPEWSSLGEECVALPKEKRCYTPYNYPPQPLQNAYTVCYNSMWQDAIAAGIDRAVNEYDIDGVYLDGTANPWKCSNRAHGCGYIHPDGTIALTYPFFAVRRLMKRIYTIIKKKKPNGQVNVHNSTYMTIPTLSWTTSYWDGEQFGWEGGPDDSVFRLISLDVFRCEFMGHQWGVPAEFLADTRGPFKYRESYAFTLLHDVLIRTSLASGPELELESKLWRLNDEFGRKQAEWLPYWQNSDYIEVKPEGVYASLYLHSKNGILAVISNLTQKEEMVKVDFKLKGPYITDNLVAFDALTKETVRINQSQIKLKLPSLGWRLLWVKTK